MSAPGWLRSTPFAIFDLETTGADIKTAGIVQAAVLHIDDGKISDRWSALVNPGTPIPPEASEVHGITDADVAGAPSWGDVLPEFSARISKRGLAGYNAAYFDWPIIERESEAAGVKMEPRRVLDVLTVVRDLDRWVKGSGRHKLTTTAERRGVEAGKAHDALGDCETTWALLQNVLEEVHPNECRNLREYVAQLYRDAERQERDYQAWKARQPQ